MWTSAKIRIRGKFIGLNAYYIRNKERYQINNLSWLLITLRNKKNKSKLNVKSAGKRKLVKSKAEFFFLIMKKVSSTKNLLLEKINTIDKPLGRAR